MPKLISEFAFRQDIHAKTPYRLWLNIAVCAICSGLSVCIISMNLAISSATAVVYAPSASYATVPVACVLLGMLMASLPLSWLYSHIGRQAGFYAAAGVGLSGCALLAAGMSNHIWLVMCFGYVLIGLGNGVSQFFIFAANDGAPSHLSGRISGIVLLGGLAAAFFGPRAAVAANDASFLSLVAPEIGSFASVKLIGVPLLLAGFFCLSALTLVAYRPLHSSQDAKQGRLQLKGLKTVLAAPRFWAVMLIPAAAYGAMTLVMNATTPMMTVCGFALSSSSTVISWHLFMMFAPAPLCGHIADRIGARNCAAIGFICLGLSGLITLHGTSFMHFAIALCCLGGGWGLSNIAGAKLVVAYSRTAPKAETEALNTFGVATLNIISAMGAGLIFVLAGWGAVIAVASLIVVVGMIASWMTTRLPETA